LGNSARDPALARNWHETFVEFASVQGTVAARGVRRLPGILGAYKRHFNAVV
jgi:hypothetical protein